MQLEPVFLTRVLEELTPGTIRLFTVVHVPRPELESHLFSTRPGFRVLFGTAEQRGGSGAGREGGDGEASAPRIARRDSLRVTKEIFRRNRTGSSSESMYKPGDTWGFDIALHIQTDLVTADTDESAVHE